MIVYFKKVGRVLVVYGVGCVYCAIDFFGCVIGCGMIMVVCWVVCWLCGGENVWSGLGYV